MFKLLARKADGARFSPYGRIIFSLLSKREKKDRIVCYVCIYNFFLKRFQKNQVYAREIKSRKRRMRELVLWMRLLFISNSLPTNEDICSSVIVTWSVWYSACAKVLCFTITNKHGRSTEANVMSSTAFCGGQSCQLREKKMEKVERKRKTDRDFYDVGVIEVDTTRKQLKIHFAGFSHEYDEWRDYDDKRN